MIDPLLIAAIRRTAHELSVKPDDELAQLGQLVALLADAVGDSQTDGALMFDRALLLVEAQTAELRATREAILNLHLALEPMYAKLGLEWDPNARFRTRPVHHRPEGNP